MSSLTYSGHRHRIALGSAPDSPVAPLATPALVLGLVLVGFGFAALLRLGDWIGNYGHTLVFLAYFLYLAASIRLTLWGGVTAWAARHSSASSR
ncbi:hypothetical protein [Nocardia camponoti]|uniref:Uncharacterized protein n=1 Tax=Nocardia camponoti TaxID=1616106 RepID=A0A917Q705_9NOCA|nr:hypothetical protein [Nocardia camponoti]GGK32407.1 hypothetical protein GCM10011591_00250 [Nocardia camponoti]